MIHTFGNQNPSMTRFTANTHRFDPYKNFKFRIIINGRVVAGITEVSGLPTEVFESKTKKRKMPGLQKFSNITLKRGVTHDADFFNWANSAKGAGSSNAKLKQNDFRKDVTIELRDEDGKLVLSYLLTGVWISKISAANLDAKGNELAIETIELVHEGLEITRC